MSEKSLVPEGVKDESNSVSFEQSCDGSIFQEESTEQHPNTGASSVHPSSGVGEEVSIEDGIQETIAPLRKSNRDNKGFPPKRLGYTVK